MTVGPQQMTAKKQDKFPEDYQLAAGELQWQQFCHVIKGYPSLRQIALLKHFDVRARSRYAWLSTPLIAVKSDTVEHIMFDLDPIRGNELSVIFVPVQGLRWQIFGQYVTDNRKKAIGTMIRDINSKNVVGSALGKLGIAATVNDIKKLEVDQYAKAVWSWDTPQLAQAVGNISDLYKKIIISHFNIRANWPKIKIFLNSL